MSATNFFRGWDTYFDEKNKVWRYLDNDEIADFTNIRPCKKCGKVFDGSNVGKADPCLGELPGVNNACCGHGQEGYIRFINGVVIRGKFTIEN